MIAIARVFNRRLYKYLEKNDSYENCVICDKKTGVKKSQSIDERHSYLEGMGQLCNKCYKQLEKGN